MTQIISYTARNGTRVDFSVGQHDLAWRDVPGLYMFCARTESGVPVPVYIGQADNFRHCIPNHPQWEAASEMGAVAVLVRAVQQEEERDRLENLLLAEFDPPLNEAHAPVNAPVFRFRQKMGPTARI